MIFNGIYVDWNSEVGNTAPIEEEESLQFGKDIAEDQLVYADTELNVGTYTEPEPEPEPLPVPQSIMYPDYDRYYMEEPVFTPDEAAILPLYGYDVDNGNGIASVRRGAITGKISLVVLVVLVNVIVNQVSQY